MPEFSVGQRVRASGVLVELKGREAEEDRDGWRVEYLEGEEAGTRGWHLASELKPL